MKIFLDSIPKTGAHLVEKALALLGFTRAARPLGSSTLYGRNEIIKRLTRSGLGASDTLLLGIELATPVRTAWVRRRLGKIGPGTYGRGHVRHSEAFAWLLGELDLRVIHMIRDPRDVAVSHAHYCTDHTGHLFHRHYRGLASWEERLAFSITGGPIPGVGYLESLAGRYRSMEPWEADRSVLTLRFEELVGERGGGDDASQRAALAALCRHAGREPDDALLDRVTDGIFGGTSTFRKGRIGGWRESFGRRHHELMLATAAGLAERWGYPRE